MNAKIVIVVCLVALASTAFAGDDPSSTRALEFDLGGNVHLEALEDLDLAYRVRTSDTRGWRYGLALSASTTDLSSERENPSETTDSTTDRKRAGVTLSLQRLHYTHPKEGVSFYWGVGPSLTYSSMKQNDTASDDRTSENNSRYFSAGLDSDFGVEWRIVEQLSLGARYRWTAAYTTYDDDSTAINEDGDTSSRHYESDSFSLNGSNQVDVIVSFHF